MQKIITLLVCFIIIPSFGFTQETFFDDFESYSLTSTLGVQSDRWTTWSGEEGGLEDATLTSQFAFSGTKSLSLIGDINAPAGGPEDCILKLGNLTSGVYELSWMILVNDADAFFYSIQHFETPGIEWAFQVVCEAGGIINDFTLVDYTVNGVRNSFSIKRGEWTEYKHIIDLDNDEITLVINNQIIDTWTFSYQLDDNIGTNQLGGVNFFPIDFSHKFYVDDVRLDLVNADEEPPLASTLRIYPTLSRSFINIEPIAHQSEYLHVQMINALGQNVLQQKLDGQARSQLNIANLADGYYRVLIVNEVGQVLHEETVIKNDR